MKRGRGCFHGFRSCEMPGNSMLVKRHSKVLFFLGNIILATKQNNPDNILYSFHADDSCV